MRQPHLKDFLEIISETRRWSGRYHLHASANRLPWFGGGGSGLSLSPTSPRNLPEVRSWGCAWPSPPSLTKGPLGQAPKIAHSLLSASTVEPCPQAPSSRTLGRYCSGLQGPPNGHSGLNFPVTALLPQIALQLRDQRHTHTQDTNPPWSQPSLLTSEVHLLEKSEPHNRAVAPAHVRVQG